MSDHDAAELWPPEISRLSRRIPVYPPTQIFGGWGHFYSRYGIAASAVMAALAVIAFGQIIFGSAALTLLAVAIVTASKFAGIGGGIFSAILSTLAADFFFLPPLFAFDFHQSTWILAIKYSTVALLSYFIFRKNRSRDVQIGTSLLGASGHLDGVTDGEIFGWAVNPKNPNEPAKITAYINGRAAAEAMAVYYRPDVAELFNCSGRNGFYLDLSRVNEVATDAMIDVRLSNGKYLEGAPIRAHLPRDRRSRTPTLLFMHIPKTAGTALRETILKNYKQSEVAYIYPEPPGFPVRNLRDLPLGQRAQLHFVVGHFQYGVHEEIPNDYLYFTIVRNPVRRVWSHYRYLVQHNHPLTLKNGQVQGLKEMLQSGVTANFDNLMVRCFAGVNEKDFPPGSINAEIYDLARCHAEYAFLYVGQQERIRDAYLFLHQQFWWSWTAAPEMMNSGSYASKEQLGEFDAGLIQRFNTWDCKLYEHVRNLFP
jgi:hypothetical protein